MHQTTIVHWAFLWDFLIIYTYLMCSQPWSHDERKLGLYALFAWMFVSKFIKLIGHYVRHPFDFLLLPVSIVFGYLHGLIKAKAMLSLNVVSCESPSSMAPTAQAQWCLHVAKLHRGVIDADVTLNMADCLGHQRWRRRRRCLSHDPSQSEAAGGWRSLPASTAECFLDERKFQVLAARHGTHDANIGVHPLNNSTLYFTTRPAMMDDYR